MGVERKYERDIDLLLAEEVVVSPPFAAWLLRQTVFAEADAKVVDVYVSRSDATGESDLVVVFEERNAARRFALLIEDKIDAPLQPEQEQRYRLRAQREVDRGDYQTFEILLCAPRAYVDAHLETKGFDRFVSYESISEFLSEDRQSLRAQYRANFIATAATRNANTWKRVSDERTNAFWRAAYDLAAKDFVVLELKPRELTKDSSWITVRPQDFPTKPIWTYVSLKGDRGFIDLTFTGSRAHQFSESVGSLLETGMSIHQTGKSAAIRLQVTGFTPSETLDAALPKVRQAFEACKTLIRFYRRHRIELEQAARASAAD